MFKLKVEFYLNTIFLFSVIALSAAFFIEYILGHQPCNLCILERIPFNIGLSFLTLDLTLLLIDLTIFSLFFSIFFFLFIIIFSPLPLQV